MTRERSRSEIIDSLRRLRDDIRQLFIDAESYNENSPFVKAGCEPVHPDPYGEMRRLLTAVEHVLDNDPGHGPIAELRFERSH